MQYVVQVHIPKAIVPGSMGDGRREFAMSTLESDYGCLANGQVETSLGYWFKYWGLSSRVYATIETIWNGGC